MANPTDQPTATGTIVGGPGGPAPADIAPKLVPVKYGGREFTVPEDVAQAWTARETEFGRKLSETSDELGQLRQVKRQYDEVRQTITPTPERRPDLGVRLFENPNEALADFKKEIVEEVKGLYSKDQDVRDFWREFYGRHEDLKGEDALVETMSRKHWAELSPMQRAGGQDKLADLTRGEILRISRKHTGGTDEELPQGRAIIEGGGPAAPRRKAAEPDEGPKSLSEVIRGRRAERLNPQAQKKG